MTRIITYVGGQYETIFPRVLEATRFTRNVSLFNSFFIVILL